MNRNNKKAWLYLLPAFLFLAFFMVYPLIDVFVYSLEEGFNFASQTYFGVGLYNFSYLPGKSGWRPQWAWRWRQGWVMRHGFGPPGWACHARSIC